MRMMLMRQQIGTINTSHPHPDEQTVLEKHHGVKYYLQKRRMINI